MITENVPALCTGRAWRLAIFAVCLAAPAWARANDIPPAPDRYFNDYAHVVDPKDADAFNTELADFERQTSNQIVVAVYPKLNTDDSLDDYCYRTYQAWGVGQKDKSNGAVLFVFVQDHKMRIQTGYGLEGALPDVTCSRILNDEMAPYFKRGDYEGGLHAGMEAMMAAAKGEYKGTGRTVHDRGQQADNSLSPVFFIIFVILWLLLALRRTRGVLYGSRGFGNYGGFYMGGGGFSGGGSGGGGGGFSGGFSGGGGSSGGGGASGSW